MVGSNYIKIVVCAWVFVFNSTTHAQINLVPNPSFEIYSNCPSVGSEVYYAIPWLGTGGAGGVDYYNSCGTTNYSVPSQGSLQYQPARTGVAYIGLFTLNGYGGNYREHLQVQLIDSLKYNNCYKVTFYVNLINRMDLATNNIGLYFSDSLYTPTNPWEILSWIPQILPFDNKPINDTINWVEISGIYVASGGEKYISIGNFFEDNDTDTIHTGDSIYNGAYYYIDDVSVIPIDSIPGGMPAYAGVDTNVTIGDSVFIGQQISNLNCNWYNAIGSLIANGTSGIYVSPTVSTFYVVEQNLCGVITYDTVNVTVLPVSINELRNKIEVRIYPNPNNGSFTIEHNLKEGNYVLEIVDLMGKVVHHQLLEIKSNKIPINIHQLSNGIYFINILNNQIKEQIIKKLILQH